MNKVQKAYALAKAAYKAAEDEETRVERAFIARHNIKNSDGTTPDYLWKWDAPDDEWDAMNALLDAEEGGQAALDMMDAAKKALVSAEDALIEYAISISPAGIRDTLRRGAKNQLSVREKLIDLAFRLDTRTVRA